jgi:hypothetical protein
MSAPHIPLCIFYELAANRYRCKSRLARLFFTLLLEPFETHLIAMPIEQGTPNHQTG